MIKSTMHKILATEPCTIGWSKFLYTHDFITKEQRDLCLSEDSRFSDLKDCDIYMATNLTFDELLWCLRAFSDYDRLWQEYASWVLVNFADDDHHTVNMSSMSTGWASALKAVNNTENYLVNKAYEEAEGANIQHTYSKIREDFREKAFDKLYKVCEEEVI